jgi:hypothetical protein
MCAAVIGISETLVCRHRQLPLSGDGATDHPREDDAQDPDAHRDLGRVLDERTARGAATASTPSATAIRYKLHTINTEPLEQINARWLQPRTGGR